MRNRLLNLIRDNAQSGQQLKLQANAGEATLYMYDVIDDLFGISAEMVARELQELEADTIHLRINSPGGDVFAGRAIQTVLAQHPARVVAHVDGLAASAATFVSTAADEIRISDGGFYMIHKGWSLQIGNADDMRDLAGLLDQVDESIARTYQQRTGQNYDDIIQWMADETWMSAEEARERGFVDAVDEVTGAARNMSQFNLSAYTKAPELPDPEPDYQAHRAHLERRLKLLEA